MIPAMLRLRRLLSERVVEEEYSRDVIEQWALVEIAYQLDRIADNLAEMAEPQDGDDLIEEREDRAGG